MERKLTLPSLFSVAVGIFLVGQGPLASAADGDELSRLALEVPPYYAAACADLGIEEYQSLGLVRAELIEKDGALARFLPSENAKINSETNPEVYGAKATLKFIHWLGDKVQKKTGAPITVTAITTDSLVFHDGHCTHRSGFAFDIRPLPGAEPSSWFDGSPKYSKDATYDVLSVLIRSRKVKRIFFNDPELLANPELLKLVEKRNRKRGWPQVEFRDYTYEFSFEGQPKRVHHDNHIHVELQTEI